MGKVSLLSLGCPKNLVDSETLLRKLADKGIYYTARHEDSDIIIVNTCGFIESAKQESIEEILTLSQLKKDSPWKKLVVFGCLAKRYGEVIQHEIPEIDALWGVGDDEKIVEYCRSNISDTRQDINTDKLAETPYAYLKIAEGCDRGCSYCAIPGIRGKFLSRAPEQIVHEAETLIKSGIKELIVIAQDITSYGKEFRGYHLSRLVKEIASIAGDFWVRLLYLYPSSIDDELLDTIRTEEKVCNYIDMPLQHSERRILKLMGRGGSRSSFEKLIAKIRSKIPGVNIRTTFIAGFPQETEEDFEALLGFIRKIQFDRLGAFTYSREKGTPAYNITGNISQKIKKERYGRIMEAQARISLDKNKVLVGKSFKALVDEVDDSIAIARIYSQAPEIDGVVMIPDNSLQKGSFIKVRITEAYDYDLKGIAVA